VADLSAVDREASGRLTALRTTNLSDRVANAIVDAIATGMLKPGQRLIETEIAADLGVSRLPVREAFKTLATQGIVELNLHRGARISPIGDDRVASVRTVRTALEQLAFGKAAAAYKGDPTGLKALDSIIAAMKHAEERSDLHALNRLDIEFHRCIVNAARDPFLSALWEALAHHLRIVFAWEVKALPRPIPYVSVHMEIRYALGRGDRDELETLVARHIAGQSRIDGAPVRGRTSRSKGRK